MLRGALARLAWTVMAGAAYVWPLDQPAVPTSTFAEYRSGHFHGGLDLSTKQIVGLPVRALDAGEVTRVRASGVGYGRGLYLRLVDGRTVVYGHLDGLAPDLERWLGQLQDSTGRYEQDVQPPAGRFRYGRGDLVGYSGESGAGPAHLHFEVRDGDTAVNPLTLGFAAPDSVAPALTALWVYPASAASRVDGATAARRVVLRRGPDGVARAAGELPVAGPVRVAVEACDRTQAAPNRLALYAVAAALDGAPVYEARFDSVSWLDPTEADVVFDARVRFAGGGDAYALTPPAGLRCLALRRAEEAWELARGRHVLAVEAADPAGNTARAEAVLVWVDTESTAVRSPSPGSRAASRRAGEAERAQRFAVEFFRDGLVARGGERAGFSANLPGLGPVPSGPRAEASFALAEGFFGPVEVAAASEAGGAARRFLVAEGRPGWEGELRSPDGAFVLALESASMFERFPLALELAPDAAPGSGSAVLARYRVGPEWLPLRQSASVRVRLPAGRSAERVGLFRRGRDGKEFLGGADAAAGWLSGRTRALGEFVAMRDTVAPLVGEARIRAGGVSPGWGARPAPFEVRWRAGDGGAGVDAAAAALEVDGRRVPVEYDPEAGVCRWRPEERPAAGRHAYRLTVGDRLGNRSTRGGTFRVR